MAWNLRNTPVFKRSAFATRTTTASRPTQREIREAIHATGLRAVYASSYGEWRVNYAQGDPRRTPDSCYFTDDPIDALQTARLMSEAR